MNDGRPVQSSVACLVIVVSPSDADGRAGMSHTQEHNQWSEFEPHRRDHVTRDSQPTSQPMNQAVREERVSRNKRTCTQYKNVWPMYTSLQPCQQDKKSSLTAKLPPPAGRGTLTPFYKTPSNSHVHSFTIHYIYVGPLAAGQGQPPLTSFTQPPLTVVTAACRPSAVSFRYWPACQS